MWRKLPRGQRRSLWHAPTRGANLLELAAGPATTVLTFHRPGKPPVRVALNSVRDPAGLSRTTSHRQWASTYGYDARGNYLLETAEGRRILFDPQTGRPRR